MVLLSSQVELTLKSQRHFRLPLQHGVRHQGPCGTNALATEGILHLHAKTMILKAFPHLAQHDGGVVCVKGLLRLPHPKVFAPLTLMGLLNSRTCAWTRRQHHGSWLPKASEIAPWQPASAPRTALKAPHNRPSTQSRARSFTGLGPPKITATGVDSTAPMAPSAQNSSIKVSDLKCPVPP